MGAALVPLVVGAVVLEDYGVSASAALGDSGVVAYGNHGTDLAWTYDIRQQADDVGQTPAQQAAAERLTTSYVG